ncbi:MAG: AraC family transcriptional regulator [Sneathiellaceae bacterium]
MQLSGHGDQKYPASTRLQSSAGRGWPGLLAERWHHRAGALPDIEPRETELIVMTRGRLHVRRRGDGRLQRTAAVPGTIWLCPAGIREDMIRLYGEIQESVHVYLPAAPLAATALQDLEVDPARLRLRYDGGFHDPVIEQLSRAVLRELRQPGPTGALLAESLGLALAAYLLRHHSNIAPAALPLARAEGALDAGRQRRIRDFIADNLAADLSLEQLAAEACLSRYHFARAFKSAFGCPPHRYILARRLERAQRMLANPDLTLAEIAAACGFASPAHFSRAFRQATGQPPGAWRAAGA